MRMQKAKNGNGRQEEERSKRGMQDAKKPEAGAGSGEIVN
jgi:hypothetical protein